MFTSKLVTFNVYIFIIEIILISILPNLHETCENNKLVGNLTFYDWIDESTRRQSYFRLTCTQKNYTLCKICNETNLTCNQYAARHNWTRNSFVLNNVTVKRLKNELYVSRNCCRSVNLNLTKCQNITWTDSGKRIWTYDIQKLNNSKMKCPNGVVLRDVFIKDDILLTQFTFDVCCLNYSKIPCLVPPNAFHYIPTNLQDVLGIGLLLGKGDKMDCQSSKVTVMPDSAATCTTFENSFLGAEACCKKCVRTKALGCAWAPPNMGQILIPRNTCSVCKAGYGSAVPVPGTTTFVPN